MTSQSLVMVTGFVTGVILARHLGADGRGVLAAAMVYPVILQGLGQLGIKQASTYYVGRRVYEDARVVGAVATLAILTGLLGIAAATALMSSVGNPALSPLIIALAVASIPASLMTSYASGVLLGKRLVGQFVRITLIAALLRLLGVVILVWWLGTDVPGALLATLLSSITVAAYAFYRLSRVGPLQPSADWTLVRALVAKGTNYALALFVLTLNYRVDVALMGRLSSSAETGTYAVAAGLAELTWFLPQSITTAIFSHSVNAENERAFSEKVTRLFRVTIIIALTLVVAAAAAAPILIPLVYGPEFQASVLPMQVLLPGVFCLTTLKILNMDLAGRGRPNVSLWATLPALAVNILLNVLLLPRYGALGAAIASSISYSLASVGFVVAYTQVTGIRISELARYRRSDFAFLKTALKRGRA